MNHPPTQKIHQIARIYGRQFITVLVLLTLLFTPVTAQAFSETFATGFAAVSGVILVKAGACAGLGLISGGVLGIGCVGLLAVVGSVAGLLGGLLGDNLVGKVLDGFFSIISTIAQWIVALFINFSATLLNLSIELNTIRVTDFQPVVTANAFTTQLANMFLIALLILIALATILQIESYGVRKILPLLLVLAIVVNFSTLAVGMIIDVGNVLFDFFWSSSNFQGISLNEYIIRNLKITEFISGNSTIVEDLLAKTNTGAEHTSAAAVSGALSMVIILIGFFAGYVFLRLALLLLMRIGVFWFLIMTAPVVFVFAALPQGKGYFKEWWKQLLNWSFLGAFVLFFIFFGLIIWTALNSFMLNTSVPGGTTRDFSSLAMIYITPIVLLFFSYALKISKSMAGAAANAIVDSVVSIGKGIAFGGLALAGSAAIAGVGGAALRQPWTRRLGESLRRSQTPFLRKTGNRLMAANENELKGTQDDIKIAEKGFEDIVEQYRDSPVALENNYRNLRDPRQRLGYIRAMNVAGAPLNAQMIGDVQRYAPSLDRETLNIVREFYPQTDTRIYMNQDPAQGFDYRALHTRFDKAKQAHKISLEGFTDIQQRREAFIVLATTLNNDDRARIARDPNAYSRFDDYLTDITAGMTPGDRGTLFNTTDTRLGFPPGYARQTYDDLLNWRNNAARNRSRAPRGTGGGGGGTTPPAGTP